MDQAALNATIIGEEDAAFAGGSYVIVQKYLHDLTRWNEIPVAEQEKIIGRTKLADIELDDAVKPSSAHNALTTIIEDGEQLEIVRDNMPFGDVGKAAASDLGARPAYVFRTVTIPLSLPGIVSGAILVFVPAVGEYVIPELVGNSSTMMIGGILWDEFFQNRDWPLAAAIALVTFGLLMMPALVLRRRLGHLGAVS